jgi:hypothetical protein
MFSFTTLQDPPSHLLTSLVLAFIASIPNHTVRYSALGVIVTLSVLCVIQLKSASTQLRHLTKMIDETDELLRRAAAHSPRNYFELTKEMLELLECVLFLLKPSMY